jgi:heme O synthase-like polyprenyltransferase
MKPLTLPIALRLGRVSNLPTVTSNVLAAVALSRGKASPVTIAVVCVAMSLMYVAGMFLNDAFDREIDARERPERPIPSGQIGAGAVFDAGFVLLLAGIALTIVASFATGAGWRPILCSVALAALIVIYDAHHKGNPFSAVVMGLCRVGVYATAGFLVAREVDSALLGGIVALLAYLIGLTHIARAENLARLDHAWPLAFLAVPFVIAWPSNGLAVAIYIAFLISTLRALVMVSGRQIKHAVGALIAGISLLDACLAAKACCPRLAIAALAAWAATLVFQRIVPGT